MSRFKGCIVAIFPRAFGRVLCSHTRANIPRTIFFSTIPFSSAPNLRYESGSQPSWSRSDGRGKLLGPAEIRSRVAFNRIPLTVINISTEGSTCVRSTRLFRGRFVSTSLSRCTQFQFQLIFQTKRDSDLQAYTFKRSPGKARQSLPLNVSTQPKRRRLTIFFLRESRSYGAYNFMLRRETQRNFNY